MTRPKVLTYVRAARLLWRLSPLPPERPPTHTSAAPHRPHPAHSLPRTRKKRHFPAPPVLGPATSNPMHVLPIPTLAPFLPTNPPQSHNLAGSLDYPALSPLSHPVTLSVVEGSKMLRQAQHDMAGRRLD